MKASGLCVGLLFCLAIPSLGKAQNCTPLDPRQQVSEKTTHDIGVAAQTVLKVGSLKGSYKDVTEKEVKNLYDRYPEADQIVLKDKLTYLFCTTLQESNLHAERKIQELHAFIRTISEVSGTRSRHQENRSTQRGDENELHQRNEGGNRAWGNQQNELHQIGNNNRSTQINH